MTRDEIFEIVRSVHPDAVLLPQTGVEDPVVHIAVAAGDIYIHKFEDSVERILAARVVPRQFQVCTSCPLLHVENCHTCFGFGVYAFTHVPVSAGEACWDGLRGTVLVCPECGSIANGVEPNS